MKSPPKIIFYDTELFSENRLRVSAMIILLQLYSTDFLKNFSLNLLKFVLYTPI